MQRITALREKLEARAHEFERLRADLIAQTTAIEGRLDREYAREKERIDRLRVRETKRLVKQRDEAVKVEADSAVLQ